MKKKSHIWRSVRDLSWRVLVLVLFFVVASVVVAYARGYKVDFNTRTIEATGALSLAGNQSDLSIVVNGKVVGNKLPFFQSSMQANQNYHVSIAKDGYQAWTEDFTLEPERIESYGYVRLFANQYQSQPSSAVNKAELCNKNTPSKNEILSINGSELSVADSMVQRVSVPIVDACWFNDKNHISYATANDVWVVEVDGNNTTKLISSTEIIKQIAVSSDNSKIYYQLTDDSWNEIVLN